MKKYNIHTSFYFQDNEHKIACIDTLKAVITEFNKDGSFKRYVCYCPDEKEAKIIVRALNAYESNTRKK